MDGEIWHDGRPRTTLRDIPLAATYAAPSSMYIGDILFPERPQPSSKMKNKNNGRNGVAIYRTMLNESMCQHYESFEK